MGENVTPPTGTDATQNDPEAFRLMTAMVKSQLAADFKKQFEKESVLAVPSLEKKGFQVQVQFNADVLRILLNEPESPTLRPAIEMLKERNALLIQADKDPSVLETFDIARQIQTAQGSSKNTMSTVLLAKSLADTNSRKRKQPFRPRGTGVQRPVPQFDPQLPTIRDELAALRRDLATRQSIQDGPSLATKYRSVAQSAQRAPGVLQCFACHQIGHIAPRCPNKFW